MTIISGFIALIGRALLSALFIFAGFDKAGDIAGTGAYLTSVGLPPNFAWPVAVFEIVAGFFILFGIFTRLTALVLAVFCLLTALMFHNDFDNPVQVGFFFKNISIAGGFLVLVAYGTIAHSFDSYRARRKTVVVERETVRDPVVVHDDTTRHV